MGCLAFIYPGSPSQTLDKLSFRKTIILCSGLQSTIPVDYYFNGRLDFRAYIYLAKNRLFMWGYKQSSFYIATPGTQIFRTQTASTWMSQEVRIKRLVEGL